MAFVFKAIKPGRLNVEGIRREVEAALEAEGRLQVAELRKTVETWANPPDFEALTDTSGGNLAVLVGPTGDAEAVKHWVWTDQGTQPHPIVAVKAPALAFQEGFSPKTLPGHFASYPAGHWGALRRPIAVDHPGTEARGWSATLSKERLRPFQRAVIEAVQRGSKFLFQPSEYGGPLSLAG